MKTKKLAKALLRVCNTNPDQVVDGELSLTITIVVDSTSHLTNKQRLALALKEVVKQHGN